ncbi:hybrid sensor histidine kinase/response regulator [Alkalimarinus alittae]|uniref:histidine kinase n=1 Tax=Alkalimarinus alittae TaxID=2961619 RepID=A0ABY6N3U2_9ALTE|nr:ATP-binding protein [Alkalimarinus alittae]UZE96793.1 ATP-binding protein [Alkalimarinus alittae]
MSEQHVSGHRRRYNRWVANQTLEDYALRFTAKSARKWSVGRVTNTALGAISFLALEAIGGVITVHYGFDNALAAILVVSLIIFLTGLPIAYYAARYGVDIDLLSRGAGFGYIGSTITSLIYASFTFIFFALEAAIMASALELLFGLPLSIGYLMSSLMVIPLATHGITLISRFQLWSQPIWLVLQLTPFVFILWHEWSSVGQWASFNGIAPEEGKSFNVIFFGAASGVLFSLVAQIGEQVDVLRFLPQDDKKYRWRWWVALISAGPGWIIVGALKILAGSFLAVLAINNGIAASVADDPIQMYLVAFSYLNQSPMVTLALAGIFVVICQIKINVTNAYAGSIAWSNFFSRLTHSHPGRVVWLVFNVMIALLVMELGVYSALENILGIYSSIAVAWVGALVADLVINKPLGLSPRHIEFKRAHLYDINPVGVGAMLLASILGITAYSGEFGELAQALSPYIALFTAFLASPIIAYATQGRYYIARKASELNSQDGVVACKVCQNNFETEDMALCPAYGGAICSLCCSLDARCHDQCKTEARLGDQLAHFVSIILPRQVVSRMNARLLQFSGLLLLIAGIIGTVFSLVYLQIPDSSAAFKGLISSTLFQLFFILMIIVGVLVWLFVLANESRQLASEESQRQMELLSKEVSAHKMTDKALQQAKEIAEAANLAKSRYLTGISHELRSPLNSLLGYAQILEKDTALTDTQLKKVNIIRRSGDHLADLIEGLLDISRIEAGRIEFRRDHVLLKSLIDELIEMFRIQAEAKGIVFEYVAKSRLPNVVVVDEKHLRQILINLLSNAVKFTQKGRVRLEVRYRNQVAEFTISDSGMGIAEDDIERVFDPFERVRSTQYPQVTGTGLGLTISKLLTEVMGGDIELTSQLGVGSTFKLALMLSSVDNPNARLDTVKPIVSYEGKKKTVMVVDDEPFHRGLISEILSPLGFYVLESPDALSCLRADNLADIDLFLLDISMPDMNGWSLVETLREQGVTVPIIMVSADAYENPDVTMQEDTAVRLNDDYITKPIRDTVLLEKIAKVLDLTWVYKAVSAMATKPEAVEKNIQCINLEHYQGVSGDDLRELIAMAELGFVDGISKILARLEQSGSAMPFVDLVRQHLDSYQFSDIISMSKKGLM